MLSVCYILKNEEEFLERSLRSCLPLSEDIHLLDTGSADGSLEIMKSLQKESPGRIQLYQEAWRDDFAWARNWVADRAKGPWILFVDGDEILDSSALTQLPLLLQDPVVACWSLIQRNYTRTHDIAQSQRHTGDLPPGLETPIDGGLYFFDNWMERLYRKDRGIRFEGRVHESLIPSCRRLHQSFKKIPLILHHYGRLKKGDPSLKSHYYLQLSQQKLEEDPENPAAWIEWIRNLNEQNRNSEALQFSKQARQRFPQEAEVLKAGVESSLRAEDYALAEQWCRQIIQICGEDSVELQVKNSLCTAVLYQGRLDEARELAEQVSQLDSKDFSSRFHLGVIYFEKREWKLAKAYLEECQKMKPEDPFISQALHKISSHQTKED